jgi:hypothetical protein
MIDDKHSSDQNDLGCCCGAVQADSGWDRDVVERTPGTRGFRGLL